MGKMFNFCSLLLISFLIFGCASGKGAQVSNEGMKTANAPRNTLQMEDETVPHNATAGKKLVSKAHTAIGTPYVLGGSNPGGFDCSGLVKWTYESVGVTLPRTAREQSVVGKTIKNVKDMRAGDIVAFRHPKRGYHTGIYVGDGKFIHSPRKRTRVRINSLSDPYFSQTLLSARRININSGANLVAQAESVLGTIATPRSMRAHKALSEKKAVTSVKSKRTQKSVKTVAAKKTVNKKKNASSKTVKSKQTASLTKKHPTRFGVKGKQPAKTAANIKAAKNHQKTVQTVADAKRHSPVAKIIAGKANVKKDAHKSVSMLRQQKQHKAAKPRNRS